MGFTVYIEPHTRRSRKEPDVADVHGHDEAQDLLATLATHRRFMRFTVQGLSDDQLSARSTVSRLCLGGIVKH